MLKMGFYLLTIGNADHLRYFLEVLVEQFPCSSFACKAQFLLLTIRDVLAHLGFR
jgi:hypothetical protein